MERKLPQGGAARLMAPELVNWEFNGLSMTDDADTRHWQTHNSEAYKRPQTQGSNRRKHQHSNISQWDLGEGDAAPPDTHYRTANNIQFSTVHPVKRAPSKRSVQYAESFERTRVPIGSTKCARHSAATHHALLRTAWLTVRLVAQWLDESAVHEVGHVLDDQRPHHECAPPLPPPSPPPPSPPPSPLPPSPSPPSPSPPPSSLHLFRHLHLRPPTPPGATHLGRREKPEQRFVRETSGGKRVASTVWLDRNIPVETRAPTEKQSSSSHVFEWPHTILPQKQRHERPQKNYSTFLKPSGAIADGVGGTFASFTDHKTVNPGVLSRTKPAGGDQHYRTAYMSQYDNPPRHSYVKPGSEAAAIRAKQDAFQAVDLGMGHDAPWMTQTKEAFRGSQHREEDRPVQIPRAMRGSLGAKQLSR